jgi:hypothetical protein
MKRVFLIFGEDDALKAARLMPLLRSPVYEVDFYQGPAHPDFDSDEAEAVRRAMGEKIAGCDIAVCLVGENTHKDKWVDCQLRKNRNKGNRIIAMALKGVECAVMPEVAREELLTFYPWDPRKLETLVSEDRRKPFNNSI